MYIKIPEGQNTGKKKQGLKNGGGYLNFIGFTNTLKIALPVAISNSKDDGYDQDSHLSHNFQKMAQSGAFLEGSGAKVAQGKTIIKPHAFEQI